MKKGKIYHYDKTITLFERILKEKEMHFPSDAHNKITQIRDVVRWNLELTANLRVFAWIPTIITHFRCDFSWIQVKFGPVSISLRRETDTIFKYKD